MLKKGDPMVSLFLLINLRLRKKLQRRGAQILRNKAYFCVRRSDEG